MKYSITSLVKIVNNPQTFELKLTQEELKVTPNVTKVNYATCTFSAAKISEDAYIVNIYFDLSVNLIDDHDLKVKEFIDENYDELVISEDTNVDSDMEPEKNGSYDFRPTCLALFYDTVPYNFSTEELTVTEINGVTIMSEEEFAKTHSKSEDEVE